MALTATVIRRASGLDTVNDPVDLDFDPETGVSGLATATNIMLSPKGRPGRRMGFLTKQSGDYHSLWCDGGPCLVVENRVGDSAIFQVASDYSLTGVRSGLTEGARVSFARDGEKVFYLNGYESGVITGGVSDNWPAQIYVGPPTARTFLRHPVGTHILRAFSRMFLVEGNIVWWSQPFMYNLFDKARNYWQFHTPVKMIKNVKGGMFVSDSEKTYFMNNTNPYAAEPIKVADYPAIEWSEAIDYIEGAEIGIQERGLCAMWASPEGACLGTPSGQLVNLNKDKIIYPETVQQGAGLIMGYDFIHSMM